MVALYGPFGWIFSAYVLACAALAVIGYTRKTASASDNKSTSYVAQSVVITVVSTIVDTVQYRVVSTVQR
jgi:hypothetical protein